MLAISNIVCFIQISDVSANNLCLFTDPLFKPNISFFPSMKGVSEGQQQGLGVMEGFNFMVRCSIQPQYPGGTFHLTFTGPNTTHTYTLTAVNHSADFLFPEANHTHQGNYSCVYHINVSNHNLSSESEVLSVTVTGNLDEMHCLSV